MDMDGSITADEFFDKNFAGQSKGSVALKGYRYRENFTQQQLSEATGIPQRHISEMENGKRGIGKDNALKLANALNTDYRLCTAVVPDLQPDQGTWRYYQTGRESLSYRLLAMG